MDLAEDVLIVEDDPDLRELTEMLLVESGFLVRAVKNGVEALGAVAQKRPGLVLLDMLMPVMDGWVCARELRRRYGSSLPIVVMTAAEHAGQRAVEIGANGSLAKPFELDELLDVVARHLRRSEARGGHPL
jgi:DNA-binding response OmpR family regulator